MKKKSRSISKRRKLPKIIPVVVFVVTMAVVAGWWLLISSQAYTGHHAECDFFSVSTNTVKKGASFTSKVTMRNDGSTTWSPTYAVYLGTIGPTDWHLSGGNISSNVSPGQSKTFNLTAQAPNSGGAYGFQPAIGIVYQSPVKNYCPSKTITVANTPSVSITSPVSGSRVRNSVTISANANNNIPINKVEFYINGKLIGTDTSSPYSVGWNTKAGYTNSTYSLIAKAYDTLGQTNTSGPVRVAVSNSSSSGTPASNGPPSSSSPTGGRGGSSVDTKAPSSPADFQATADGSSKSVNLSWAFATDNVGVTKYELQRSENNQEKWITLSDNINPTQSSYNDLSAGFGKTLYYRIRAFDAAGNSSSYALAQVNTTEFSSNSSSLDDTIISSDDHTVSVIIPGGTITGEAFCAVTLTSDVLPPNNGLVTVTGPYQLICRTKDSNIINDLGSRLALTARISSASLKGLGSPAFYGQSSDGNWNKLKVTGHDKKTSTYTVELQDNKVFNIMAPKKSTPLIVKILLIILVIGGMILLLRLVNRFLLKRKAEAKYEDYLRKSKGL